MSRTEKEYTYQGVPDGIGEHYWHGAGVKGNWSVIKPYGRAIVNAAVNPSLEADSTRWFGMNSPSFANRSDIAAIYGSFGFLVITTAANQGAGYEMFPQFVFNTTYWACVSVNGPAGAVATFQFEYPSAPASSISFCVPTSVTLPGYPIRICVKFGPVPTDAGPILPTLPISVRFDRAGTYHIDGLVLTTTSEPIIEYFDGDSPDATWLGVPHASSSSTIGTSRTFGEAINFNESGFNATGQTGFGLTPQQLITTSYARLNGAHFQRAKDNPRVITFLGTIEGGPEEMHATRQTLIDALIWRFKNQCTQEALLTYCLRDECGCRVSDELEIPVAYQSGLEGTWSTLDRERVALMFVANTEQGFNSRYQSSAALGLPVSTTIIDYQGTDDAWPEIHMWPGAGGTNIYYIINDTTGHAIYFGYPGGNPDALPLAFGPPTREYAILRTNPAQRISLDLYQYDVSGGTPTGVATQTRIMHYIRYQYSQVGMFRLVPGENQIRVNTTGGTGGRVMLRWRNRYLSIDHLCAGACVEV